MTFLTFNTFSFIETGDKEWKQPKYKRNPMKAVLEDFQLRMHPWCKSYSNIKLANLWHPNLTTGIFIVPLAIRMHNISFKSTISGANDVSIIKTKVALLRYIFLRLLLIFHFGKVVSFFVLFTHTKLLQIKLSCPVLPYPVLSFPFL